MTKKENSHSRVAYLRELLKLSQKDFSESIGITQGALSQLESGKSQLSFESIRKISNTYRVNCNWLIGDDSSVFRHQTTKIEPAVDKKHKDHEKLSIEGLIPLVREEAHAGYIECWQDKDYLSTLDVYKIPGFEQGDYRLFEVEGDSMVPSVLPRELIVAEFVNDWAKLENGVLVILVSKEGIVAKRFYIHDNPDQIILKSDNSNYKTYTIAKHDVSEIWKIKAKITSVFADEALGNSEDIRSIRADIAELKKQLGDMQREKYET